MTGVYLSVIMIKENEMKRKNGGDILLWFKTLGYELIIDI